MNKRSDLVYMYITNEQRWYNNMVKMVQDHHIPKRHWYNFDRYVQQLRDFWYEAELLSRFQGTWYYFDDVNHGDLQSEEIEWVKIAEVLYEYYKDTNMLYEKVPPTKSSKPLIVPPSSITPTNIPFTNKWDYIQQAKTGQEGEIYWLQLPSTKLKREDYDAVNSIVVALRGKWVKKTNRHEFEYDFRDKLKQAIVSQTIPDNNPFDYFPTPSNIAQQMLDIVINRLGERMPIGLSVLEPSAGQGGILDIIVERFPSCYIYGCEIDPVNYNKLLSKYTDNPSVSVKLFCEDFLNKENLLLSRNYDIIVMNPPFTSEGDSTAYITHINKAYSLLNRNGILVSIAPNSITSRTDAKTSKLRTLITKYGDIVPLTQGAFKDSGTMVNTVIITLNKY